MLMALDVDGASEPVGSRLVGFQLITSYRQHLAMLPYWCSVCYFAAALPARQSWPDLPARQDCSSDLCCEHHNCRQTAM